MVPPPTPEEVIPTVTATAVELLGSGKDMPVNVVAVPLEGAGTKAVLSELLWIEAGKKDGTLNVLLEGALSGLEVVYTVRLDPRTPGALTHHAVRRLMTDQQMVDHVKLMNALEEMTVCFYKNTYPEKQHGDIMTTQMWQQLTKWLSLWFCNRHGVSGQATDNRITELLSFVVEAIKDPLKLSFVEVNELLLYITKDQRTVPKPAWMQALKLHENPTYPRIREGVDQAITTGVQCKRFLDGRVAELEKSLQTAEQKGGGVMWIDEAKELLKAGCAKRDTAVQNQRILYALLSLLLGFTPNKRTTDLFSDTPQAVTSLAPVKTEFWSSWDNMERAAQEEMITGMSEIAMAAVCEFSEDMKYLFETSAGAINASPYVDDAFKAPVVRTFLTAKMAKSAGDEGLKVAENALKTAQRVLTAVTKKRETANSLVMAGTAHIATITQDMKVTSNGSAFLLAAQLKTAQTKVQTSQAVVTAMELQMKDINDEIKLHTDFISQKRELLGIDAAASRKKART